MTIRKALWEGIRQTNRSLHAVLIVFTVNVILAGLSALMLRSTLVSAFGKSLAPQRLAHDFDYTVYMDFVAKNPGKLTLVFGFVLWLIILANLVSAFLDGGIIAAVRGNVERFNYKSFFTACGKYAGRFVRLLFIAILVLSIPIIALAFIAGLAFSATSGDGETEMQILRALAAALITFLVPLFALLLAVDYAKVITVTGGERRMFRAFWNGLRFVFRQFPKVYGLFLLCLIPVVILLMGWFELSMQVTTDSGLLVLGMFLVQQIVILGRAWTRVATIGGQVSFYAGSEPVSQKRPARKIRAVRKSSRSARK